MSLPSSHPGAPRSDFLREIVARHQREGTYGGRVVTRFPPEPNGYLHIGHAKSICLNFGLAAEHGGVCHLRMDDTNPSTEDPEYVAAIQRDVRWLGFDWGEHFYHAADYFERLYEYAEELVRRGHAYVCSLTEDEMREYRGTVFEPGRPSPDRDTPPERNLDLLRRMRAGEFPDGARTLRARIDLASPNMKMRDPPLYRIRHVPHYRTGSAWCIYPLYDFAHCLSDSIEGVTHSVCTLEFENNRELYDWLLDHLPVPRPRPHQYEFARLEMTYTVLSKRRLLTLVSGGHVTGWDDPRMPTLSGLRRRGVPPEALRSFCERIGVSKHNSVVEVELFESCLRETLEAMVPRALGVLRPVRLELRGDLPSEVEAPWFPGTPPPGWRGPTTRRLPVSGELLVDRDDVALEPPPGWHRLAPGALVRLRHLGVVRCEEVLTDAAGDPRGVRCRLVQGEEARGARATLHWVDATRSVAATVRLVERLFTAPRPGEGVEDFLEHLNPGSLVTLPGARLEPALGEAVAGERWQLERLGFFVVDEDSRPGLPVLVRTVTLKDSYARAEHPAPTRREREEPPPPAPHAEPRAVSDQARALMQQHGLGAELARVLGEDVARGRCFTAAVAEGGPPREVAVLLVNELPRLSPPADALPAPRELARLGRLVADHRVTTVGARSLLGLLVTEGGDVLELLAREGLERLGEESALEAWIDAVIDGEAALVARYRAGEAKLLPVLVGKVMKAAAGKADASAVRRALERRLSPG